MVANGTTNVQANVASSAVLDNQWHHLVGVYDGAHVMLYLDGVLKNSPALTGNINVTTIPVQIGRYNSPSRFFTGSVDEVAIWNRVLSANEITQLYQRGGSRVKFQVKSCTAADCSDATWKGPDGTINTFFSETFNMSTQAATPSGTVSASLPTMNLQSYTSPVATNRYFQYRTIFESDSSTATLMPNLKSVTVGPIHYDNTTPSVYTKNGTSYYSLSNYIQTLGSNGCAGGITYNLSPDKTNWYYWNGSTWTSTGSATNSNTSAVVAAHVAAYGTQLGTSSPIYVKAYLKSDGTQACELNNIELDGLQ